ncbi:hypothetical protein HBI39_070680 [Parastagonospora nodorum]|nr:hypothetical protein HBI39_070680 [Parastagonospora nodorum]
MPPKVSGADRLSAKSQYMRALRDCNDRVDIKTHPELQISLARLNAIKDKLEANTHSSHQNGGSNRYNAAVNRDIQSMENIGRSLPEDVGPWNLLLESNTVSAKTAMPNAEHRPVLAPSQPMLVEHTAPATKATPNIEHRPLFPQMQPPLFSTGAPTTANTGSPERKFAAARPRAHAVGSSAFAPNIVNTGGVFATAFRPQQSIFTFGASKLEQEDSNDGDGDREENPEPPKRLGAIAGKTLGSDIADEHNIANQPALFDEDAMAMELSLTPPPAVKAPPKVAFGAGVPAPVQQPSPRAKGQGSNDAMDVDSGEPAPVLGTGVGNATGGTSLAPSQVVPETRTQTVILPKPGTISVMGGMRKNAAPKAPVIMPQYSMAGPDFQFGSTPNAPAQPNVPQTETPANVAPLSNATPALLGETGVSNQVDVPKSTLPAAPPMATSAPPQKLPAVAENLQDTRSEDTTGARNGGQSTGPPDVSQASSETATPAPASGYDSQLSQMAAMLQTLQTQLLSLQIAQKSTEQRHASDVKVLTEQNTAHASRITALEGQMQAQQVKASADIVNLSERCNSLEKSQAAHVETAKRLDELERAVASREEAAKEQQMKLQVEKMDIAARDAAREHAPLGTAIAAEKEAFAPEADASKTSTQIAIEKPVVEVEIVQSTTEAPKKDAIKKTESVSEVEQDTLPTEADIYRKKINTEIIRKPFDSNGNSASLLDLRPRRAIEPSPMFGPSSQAVAEIQSEPVAEIQSEPVYEAAKEPVRKHDSSKGSYGLDYSSDEDETSFESEDALVYREELAALNALLDSKDHVGSVNLCLAYLKSIKAVGVSLPKGSKERKDMYRFSRDEDVRLRTKVNGVARADWLSVNDKWVIEMLCKQR